MPCEPPANGADFSRAWRRLRDDTQRVAYLRRIPPPHMAHLFKARVAGRMWASALFLGVCDTRCQLLVSHAGGAEPRHLE